MSNRAIITRQREALRQVDAELAAIHPASVSAEVAVGRARALTRAANQLLGAALRVGVDPVVDVTSRVAS